MYDYSKPYVNIQGSFIRNILKLASKKEYISFAGGLPNNELFPRNDLKKVFENFSENLPNNIFQYAPTVGLDLLIKTIQKQFNLNANLIIFYKKTIKKELYYFRSF